MTQPYEETIAFLTLIGASEDEALAAALGAFGPAAPAKTIQNWKNLASFGRSAPSTDVLWSVMADAGFACVKCDSRLRLTYDHIDNDSTNHGRENLQALCVWCNNAKRPGKAVSPVKYAKVAMYRAAMALFQERKGRRFPRGVDIAKRAGVTMGGHGYMLKFLRAMLQRRTTEYEL